MYIFNKKYNNFLSKQQKNYFCVENKMVFFPCKTWTSFFFHGTVCVSLFILRRLMKSNEMYILPLVSLVNHHNKYLHCFLTHFVINIYIKSNESCSLSIANLRPKFFSCRRDHFKSLHHTIFASMITIFVVVFFSKFIFIYYKVVHSI